MLSRHFAQRGISVHVTAFSMPENGPYFDMHETVETSAMNGRSGQFRRIAHVRSVVREYRPDIVISFLTKVNVVTLLATSGMRIPVIISERNNPRLQDAHPMWSKLQAVLGLRATKVVALTHKGLADLQPSLRWRGVVIPNPIVPFARVASAHTGEAQRLVSIGRLVPQKGFDMLLKAMRRIHSACPDVTLTIYGEGAQRPALEAQRDALGLETVVQLPGNTREMGEWAHETDIVLATSRYEGFHNVIAEATVSGIPVISFDCDYGPSDLINHGQNGLLVPPGDVDKLAESALRLIREPETRALMAARSQDMRDRLSPDRVFSEWDQLVSDVAQ
ncbi:glycosyltransferase family 4 protein [Rhodobacteraceae bacterium B1Z28]|uniref:Glycosyltransferase family 4 protein n=2 Tax=Ruegeria haliotis TaxID=2747601 RepID=A0ABX2PMW1_9RHOB|nr:glycosyltransferase family 4 protein [Ruegeria haliotis]